MATALEDQVAVHDRVVADYLIARRHNKHLLLFVHTLTLRLQDLNVRQRLANRLISRLVAETNARVPFGEGCGAFESNPLLGRLGDEVEFVDGRAVLFAKADVKVDAMGQIDYFVVGFVFFGNLS